MAIAKETMRLYSLHVARRTEGEYLSTVGSAALVREVDARNVLLAADGPHETTYGRRTSVLYGADGTGGHGNFFPASYRRILANPAWARRLEKTYTASRRMARSADRWRGELECANSSDALLMNVFCAPSTMRSATLCALLGLERGMQPSFGVRVRTPLHRGHEDRTETDMQCGDLLVEAKLSESGFQTGRPDLMARYEGFASTFDVDRLPVMNGHLRGYQLLRCILAARYRDCRFAVFADARRPDLREQWFAVASALCSAELRSRLLYVTWQEIAAGLSRPLQTFLHAKYGIIATANSDGR